MALKNRADLLISLLYSGHDEGCNAIEGITRMEKMLFLLKKEHGFLSDASNEDDFHFTPFKMGPWSQEVYDELDFLDSLELLKKRSAAKTLEEDIIHDNELINSMLLDKYQSDKSTLGANKTEIFDLSEKGIQIAKKIWNKLDGKEKEKINMLKKKFNRMNLRQFLRYVYKEHPRYTSESEIKDYLGV